MPSVAATSRGNLHAIAAHERDVLDTCGSELGSDELGAGAQVIGHHDHALEHAVDPDEDLRAAPAVPVVDSAGFASRAVVPAFLEPAARADGDSPPLHHPGDAPARRLVDVGRRRKRDPPGGRRAHEALGQHVRGELVDRRCKTQCLLLRQSSEEDDEIHLRLTARDGARLVEEHGGDGSETLEHTGALHDHPGSRRAREPPDECDRGRENERAGRRHDHHRQAPHGVAAHGPCQPGHDEREREEDGCVAVGQPRERGAVALGRPHEPDHRGVRALRRRPSHAGVEDVAGVRGSRTHLTAGRHRDGKRLARERRLVNDRVRALDDRIRRDDLAGADDDDVARHELLNVHLLDTTRAVTVRDARRALDQETELAACTTGSPSLERRAAGHHQGHDRTGQRLAEDQRSGDRHQRDGVDTDVTLQQAAGRVDGQRDEDDRRSDGPHLVGPARLVESPEDPTPDDRGERQDREHARSHGAILPVHTGEPARYTPGYTS